ncbi:MAG: acyltransferase [Terracidiphilus sp.]|jgi:peptidoglycan/LPS O-acetylase OafA/YrhL
MQRIRQLDGIRGFAILAVFLHHAFKIRLMWMGVDLFFLLSGFLITGILLNAKQYSLAGYFAKFYSRRARRILPPYLLTLLVASFFFGLAWARHWYLYLLLTNLLLPLHISHPVAFFPLWSLAVEEQFYLVWPFVVYFLSERHLGYFAAFLVVFAPVLRAVLHFQDPYFIFTLTPFRMDLLAAGALLSVAYRNMRPQIERWGMELGFVSSLFGVGGLLLLSHLGISTYGNTRLGNIWIYECALLCCLGIMLWALSGRCVQSLRWKPLTYIGQISYTMYLVHLGILTLLSPRLNPIAAGVVGFIVTVAYASASWYLMERRLLVHDRESTKLTPMPA